MTTTLLAPLTVEDIMELLPGLSARAVKEVLRETGCACQIRGKLFVRLDQFQKLLEETDLCRSKSNGATASRNSTARLTGDAYEKALELATRRTQNVKLRRSKRGYAEPKSTEQKASTRSPTQP